MFVISIQNCIMQITSFPGLGYPRTLTLFLDGCTGKHHPNYKRSCVMALTNALRAWMCEPILEKNVKAISKAVMSAATDRDPQGKEDSIARISFTFNLKSPY
jgi:hypothetical protein